MQIAKGKVKRIPTPQSKIPTDVIILIMILNKMEDSAFFLNNFQEILKAFEKSFTPKEQPLQHNSTLKSLQPS